MRKSGRTVIRQWGNVLGGWTLGFGLLFVAAFVDPLGVWVKWSGPGQGATIVNLLFLMVMSCLGVSSFAIFARPSVEVTIEYLIVRNIVHDHKIPIVLTEEVDSSKGRHLFIKADGEWYRAWGAEKSNLSYMLGRAGVAGRIEASIDREGDAGGTAGGCVTTAFRPPHPAEISLVILWLIYLLPGLYSAVL
jgi:hypothetical protein